MCLLIIILKLHYSFATERDFTASPHCNVQGRKHTSGEKRESYSKTADITLVLRSQGYGVAKGVLKKTSVCKIPDLVASHLIKNSSHNVHSRFLKKAKNISKTAGRCSLQNMLFKEEESVHQLGRLID